MSNQPPIDGRDERGRTTALPPVLRAHMFKKGEIHNPTGKGGEYQRCLALCRASSFEAAEEIVRLSKESTDERVRYMAATWVYERSWGRAQDYDPNAERPPSTFNPRDHSPEELDLIETALKLMLGRR